MSDILIEQKVNEYRSNISKEMLADKEEEKNTKVEPTAGWFHQWEQ